MFVEVEFGNVASMHRDFFEFHIANRAGAGEAAVLVCATAACEVLRLGYHYVRAARWDIPYLAIGIQMPILFIGCKPGDRGLIKARYEEMRALCEANDVACHPFDAALGAEVDVSLPPPAGAAEALGTDVVDDVEPLPLE